MVLSLVLLDSVLPFAGAVTQIVEHETCEYFDANDDMSGEKIQMEYSDNDDGEQSADEPLAGCGDVEDDLGIAGTAECTGENPSDYLRYLDESGKPYDLSGDLDNLFIGCEQTDKLSGHGDASPHHSHNLLTL